MYSLTRDDTLSASRDNKAVALLSDTFGNQFHITVAKFTATYVWGYRADGRLIGIERNRLLERE
jgi:hypothetical protein